MEVCQHLLPDFAVDEGKGLGWQRWQRPAAEVVAVAAAAAAAATDLDRSISVTYAEA